MGLCKSSRTVKDISLGDEVCNLKVGSKGIVVSEPFYSSERKNEKVRVLYPWGIRVERTQDLLSLKIIKTVRCSHRALLNRANRWIKHFFRKMFLKK